MAPPELSLQTDRFDSGRPTPRATRSQSISSDRPSLAGVGGLLSPPASISPEPAFIAASAASQIVTNDHDSQSDAWFDQHGIEPSGETALVAPPALALVNRFLDQLLYNFLSISRSTSLPSLRPAIGEVLKQKLARDAISGADQELQEYLGGGEDEELLALQGTPEPNAADWDLELVWKRTRLRCMVYSSLGDMEEEDEDFYTEQEQLDGPTGSPDQFSNNSAVVSPAVAIFLTSILEFMGEQVLMVAGQAAYHRLRIKHEREERGDSSPSVEIAERVVVEEADMERVALDRTLGRLWRSWKKRIRSPSISVSMLNRSFSRESLRSQPQASRAVSRAASVAPENRLKEEVPQTLSSATVLAEHEHAATIPLPLSADDIREIEIPGLALQSDEEDDVANEYEAIQLPPRPKSLIIFTQPTQGLLTPPSSQTHSPMFFPPTSRKRSYSLPSPAPSLYGFPASKRPKASDGELGEDQEDAKGTDVVEQNTEEQPTDLEGKVDEEQAHNALTEESSTNKGLIATAVGAVAVAGITAAANGGASEVEPDQNEEADAEEEFNEEPQILTSSRVSIGGRISPEVASAPSRRSSVRSHSVHSLRLIDVSSPKSPAQLRGISVDTTDYFTAGRAVTLSSPSSISSIHSHLPSESATPRLAGSISKVGTASPITRNGSATSSRQARPSAEEPISEAVEQEASGSESESEAAVPSRFAAAMQGVDVWSEPVSPQFTSQPVSREVTPQPAAFVLSAAPASRNSRGNANASVVESHPPQPSAALGVTKTRGDHGGIPPLTPLREMMEGAPDTSDEASLAPSYDGPSFSEPGVHRHSHSISGSSLPQRSARSQAASTIRGSPPRTSREDYSRKETKAPRSIHTSGSGSSSSASHKLKPVRTSEESVPSAVEDKGQSFEQLIRSDQTIQYTLTPQNMRDIEAPDSPRAVVTPVRVNAQEGPRPATGRSHSSSTGKYTKPAVVEMKTAPRPAPNTGARLRPAISQPRDAKADRESMGDFAEFIKSTGPANGHKAPPRSGPVDSLRGTARSTSGSEPRSGAISATSRRTESSNGRPKLQARDAAVSRDDSISDLIDFVRSGPQLEKDNHRIPRTVAPFRTTMDSDQMSGAVGGKATDATLPDARYSQASVSVDSSVTSQSALLNGSSNINKPQPSQTNRDLDMEDHMPKRKTRRVRDMYQIDFSDEEEEYEAVSKSKPKPVQEESLADFLRNVPPPPDPTPVPLIQTASRASSKDVKKKPSTTSIMSRFGRSNSNQQSPSKPKSSGQESRSSLSRSGASQVSNHTPISVQINNNYKPPTNESARGGNYVSQVDSARNKVVQKSYQPREAVYPTTRTNDLAAFLRDSEPPTPTQAQPKTFAPTVQKEESSTFHRMFGRKKVH